MKNAGVLLLGLIAGCGFTALQAQNYQFTTLAGQPKGPETESPARFGGLQGIALASEGSLFFTDPTNSTVMRITREGIALLVAGSRGQRGSVDGQSFDARLVSPAGIAVNSSNQAFVVDSDDHTVRKITADGMVSTIAGKSGLVGYQEGSGGTARFSGPTDVCLGSGGVLYVADRQNHAIRLLTADGNVTTYAGGSQGSQDGVGSNAKFTWPQGLAVDAQGNLFVAEAVGRIRKIAPDRTVTTLAGSGQGGRQDGQGIAAGFNAPVGMALDLTGNLWVVDGGNGLLRKVTMAGAVTTLSAVTTGGSYVDGPLAAATFPSYAGIVADGAGIFYVAGPRPGVVRKIAANGVVSTILPTLVKSAVDGRGTDARFWGPEGICLDANGNLLVGDVLNSTLRKVKPDGSVVTVVGVPRVSTGGPITGRVFSARIGGPNGVGVDGVGNIYTIENGSGALLKISVDGMVSGLAGTTNAPGANNGFGTQTPWNFPCGLAVDTAGNCYVSDSMGPTIRKVGANGGVSTLAGKLGVQGYADGPGTNAQFGFPYGLALDAAGNVYVADSGTHTVRKITPMGNVSTLAGVGNDPGSNDGPTGTARFKSPFGVAVASNGEVFVADYGNHLIRKIGTNSVVSTIGGIGGVWEADDGVGAAARFTSPTGIAVDSSGTLFITDTGNNLIRKGVLTNLSPAPAALGLKLRDGVQRIIRWSGDARDFILESSTNLNASGGWSPVLSGTVSGVPYYAPNIDGGEPARFYRLRKP